MSHTTKREGDTQHTSSTWRERFEELCHGWIVSKGQEYEYPIVKEGDVVLNKEKLETFVASERELLVREIIETIENDRFFAFCQGCSCDAREKILSILSSLQK